MIEYYSTFKSLSAHYACELSLDYEDFDSYVFNVTPNGRLVTNKEE